MQDEISRLGLNLLVSGITGILVALVTTRLALRRFYSERWWERKLQAYSTILESLYDMKRYSEEAIDAFESGRELSDDWKTQLHAQYSRGRNEIDKATAIGAFGISDGASRYLVHSLIRILVQPAVKNPGTIPSIPKVRPCRNALKL
jgi:hypothetical protein